MEMNLGMLEEFFDYVRVGNLPCVDTLTKFGVVPVNQCGPKGTALHVATRFGHSYLVKYLISMGAQVDKKHEGKTPLLIAIEMANLDIAKILIENGADMKFKYKDSDLFDWAIFSNEPVMIYLMLSHGFDINRLGTSSKVTPLMFAAINSKYKSFQYLLERGADYRKCSNMEILGELQPFYPTLGCFTSGDVGRILEILFSHIERKEGNSALINYINWANPSRKLTALHLVCFTKNEEAAKMLIEMGANKYSKDSWGRKPLDLVELDGKSPKSERIKSIFKATRKR